MEEIVGADERVGMGDALGKNRQLSICIPGGNVVGEKKLACVSLESKPGSGVANARVVEVGVPGALEDPKPVAPRRSVLERQIAVEVTSRRVLEIREAVSAVVVTRAMLDTHSRAIHPIPVGPDSVSIRVGLARHLEALGRRLQDPRPDLAAFLARQPGVDHGHDAGFDDAEDVDPGRRSPVAEVGNFEMLVLALGDLVPLRR